MNLTIVGFEPESESSDDPDSDWLVISALVGDDRGTRTYRSVPLEVGEARALAYWMSAIAQGDIAPTPDDVESQALLHFVEPGLAVRVLRHEEAAVTTCWCFYDRDDPDVGSEKALIDYPVRSIVVTTSGSDLESAADSWLAELGELLGNG